MSLRESLLTRTASRIRARLGLRGGPPALAGIGAAFGPALEDDWKELVEQVDADLRKVGASVVSSWEVGAAGLGRALVGRADDAALIERYSDALVPTLAAFDALHKGCAGAMDAGLRAGLSSGQLAMATAPLPALVASLGENTSAGWQRTVEHLEPVFACCAAPDAARARFLGGRHDLVAACAEADGVLRARLEALPRARTLWEGLTAATEAWQLALSRSLEIALSRHTRALVEEVKAGRP